MLYCARGDFMIVKIDALSEYDFSLSKIAALHRVPTYRTLLMTSRPKNGFLYVTKGTCEFEIGSEHIVLSEGGVMYLPQGCTHTMTVTSETIEFYRIDFNLTVDGEFTFFSENPIKLTDVASPKLHEAAIALTEATALGGNRILRMEKLCAIIGALCHTPSPTRMKKLAAAVHYLDNHFAESVNCRHLAALCFLSTAQFYNLFHTHFGLTPLEYRDRLLLRRAKAMLTGSDVTVAETASALGFKSAAYFSRFFKKQTGISPSAYAKQNRDF